MKNYIESIENYFFRLSDCIGRVSREEISLVMNVLDKARLDSRTIFIMGNGGSASTASHFVCDFNKGFGPAPIAWTHS